MFFLVEGYDRSAGSYYGAILDTRAVTDVQLGGTIIRMMRHGGANAVMVTEISEEVFRQFYQESRGRVYTHDGHKRREPEHTR